MNKIKIFLDTCFWSHYATGDVRYIEILQLIEDLVEKEKAHLVVNISLISEIGIRRDDKQIDKIYKVVERLSSNIYLRAHENIMELELESQIKAVTLGKIFEPLSDSDVFGCFLESIIPIKRAGNGSDKKIESVRLTGYSKKSLRELGEKIKSSMQVLIDSHSQKKEKSIQAAVKSAKRREFNTFLVKKTEMVVQIIKKMGNPTDEKEVIKLFEKMNTAYNSQPTSNTMLTLLEHLRWDDNRTVNSRDIYDILHLATAAPYSDIIFCDKSMRLFYNRASLGFNVKFFSEPEIEDPETPASLRSGGQSVSNSEAVCPSSSAPCRRI